MKGRRLCVFTAAGLVLAAAPPVVAHHSFAAEYDTTKSIALTGVVTKLEWTNPHAHIYIDAKDASGNVAHWEFELGSPSTLMRRGWTRNSLKPAETITVNGYLARDGARLVNAVTVTLADGRKVFAGSSADGRGTP